MRRLSVTIKSDHLQIKHNTHIIDEVKEKNMKASYKLQQGSI